MALKALSLTETFPFVSKRDDPDNNPTRFVLRPLSLRTRAQIRDTNMTFRSQANKTIGSLHMNAANAQTVRYGLVGWENFLDSKGDAVMFLSEIEKINGREIQCIVWELLDRLPASLIDELADEINRLSELAPEERKSAPNSGDREENSSGMELPGLYSDAEGASGL